MNQQVLPPPRSLITPQQAANELLNRRKARQSLHEFTRQAWPQVEGGRAFTDNWHIGAICEHLEAVSIGQIPNLLINQPPRTTKSSTLNVMWPAWLWVENPNIQWLFATYGHELTIRDSQKCRALILSPWYQARFGSSFELVDDANKLIQFNNNKGGYRLSTSIDGRGTGLGGDIIAIDDPNSTKDTSDSVLQSTIDWWTTVMPTRMNDFKNTRRVVVQQRMNERDLTGYILSSAAQDWVHLCLPMEFEVKRACVTVVLPSTKPKKWRDPRTKEGELLDTKRIGPVELKRLKRELASQYAIAGQLQQRPSPAEGGIIKKNWFKWWKQYDSPKFIWKVMSVDTALSEKKTAAYNAVTTWGVFNDEHGVPNVMLIGLWRERCEYPELRERIKRMADDYLDDKPTPRPSGIKRKPDLILVESKSSGISLLQELARGGVIAAGANPDKLGDKTQRVRLITPILEAGRVWVPAKPERDPVTQTWKFDKLKDWADLFVEQCGSFPAAESRDLVDTMTQALWRLQQSGWVYRPDDPAAEEQVTPLGGDKRELYG